MTVLRANFSSGSVQENPLAAGVTTLTMAGNLQALPTVVAPDFARLTIDPLGTDSLSGAGTEIVHVTAYTHGAGTSTILRAQEGTTDRPHSQSVKIVNAPTAQDWIDVISQHVAQTNPHAQYEPAANLTADAAGAVATTQIHVGGGAAPAFQGGWSNSGGGTRGLCFGDDNVEYLTVIGNITNAGAPNGTTIFTLPSSYRPLDLVNVPVLLQVDASHLYPAYISVAATGVVTFVCDPGLTSAPLVVVNTRFPKIG